MTNKKDFLNGDHSFRNWFRIMWKNGYIFLFLVAIGAITAEFIFLKELIYTIKDNFYDSTFGGIATIFGFLIPWMIAVIISYKVFWQFWNDLKNGRSR